MHWENALAIHPLVLQIRKLGARSPSAATTAGTFEAATEGGVTANEALLLRNIFATHGDTWSATRKRDWTERLGRMEVAPADVAPATGDSAGAEDLSAHVKTVWMTGYESTVQQAYVADMVKLGQRYGYKLVLQLSAREDVTLVARDLMARTGLTLAQLDALVDITNTAHRTSEWAEDNKVVTNSEELSARVTVLVPPTVSDAAFARAAGFTAQEGYHAFVPGSFHGAVSARGEADAAADLAARLGRQHKVTRCYVEGGNILPATSSDGQPYALVGRDSLVVSAFHMQEAGTFTDAEISARWESLRGDISTDAMARTREQLTRAEQAASWWRETNAVSDDQAARYLAIEALAADAIAADMGIPRERVVFVTQPEFHIDMHLRPLRPGEVLVNHPQACVAALDEAMADPAATAWQQAELSAMLTRAREEQGARSAVYDQIITELEQAGLIAIRAPGVFDSGVRMANFTNAVPGTTAAGETFYICNGSSVTPLQEAFARFVRSCGVDHVDFVALEGGGEHTWSAGEMSLSLAGALDCRENDTPVVETVDDLLGTVVS
jgi:hypothetical protein